MLLQAAETPICSLDSSLNLQTHVVLRCHKTFPATNLSFIRLSTDLLLVLLPPVLGRHRGVVYAC
jgi:hypothetical protein